MYTSRFIPTVRKGGEAKEQRLRNGGCLQRIKVSLARIVVNASAARRFILEKIRMCV